MLKQPYQDIKLTLYSEKDVKLGSWVLSAIIGVNGPPEAAGTAKFFLLMEGFFDIMNIRNNQLALFILVIDDLKYVLTERFTQDPPKNYFSEQRAIAARKDNWAFVTSD